MPAHRDSIYDGYCHYGRSRIFSVRNDRGQRVSTLELCRSNLAMLLALMREEERTVGVEEVLFFLSQTEDDWQPLVDEIPFHGKGPQAELLSLGMLFQVLLLQSAELSWSRQLPLPGESASQHRQQLASLWICFAPKESQESKEHCKLIFDLLACCFITLRGYNANTI